MDYDKKSMNGKWKCIINFRNPNYSNDRLVIIKYEIALITKQGVKGG